MLSCKPYVACNRSHNYIGSFGELSDWSQEQTVHCAQDVRQSIKINELCVWLVLNIQLKIFCKRNERKTIWRKQLAHLYFDVDIRQSAGLKYQFDGLLKWDRMSIFSAVQNEGTFTEWIIIIIPPTDSMNPIKIFIDLSNANFDSWKLKNLRTRSRFVRYWVKPPTDIFGVRNEYFCGKKTILTLKKITTYGCRCMVESTDSSIKYKFAEFQCMYHRTSCRRQSEWSKIREYILLFKWFGHQEKICGHRSHTVRNLLSRKY